MSAASEAESLYCLFTAQIVLPDADQIIADGALLVRNGLIVAVGRREDFPSRPDCEVVSLGAVALLPGLVNAHSHLRFTCCRNRFRPEGFADWIMKVGSAGRSLQTEEIVTGVEEGLRELARNGTTTVADISSDGLPLPGLEASGLRYILFHEIINMTTPPYEELLGSIEEKLATYAVGPRGSIGLSPHTPYTVALPLMAALRKRFHAAGYPFCVHVAESEAELECLRDQSGQLAEILRGIGFYPAGVGAAPLAQSVAEFLRTGRGNHLRDVLVHGNHLSDDEVSELAREGNSSLVLCPGTREFHGVGTPILERAMIHDLPVALGTDSVASNTELNMWTEMRRSLGMAQDWHARDAFDAATRGGALALGLEGKTGALHPGHRADFIAVPLEGALSEIAPQDLLATLVEGEASPRILETWVEGEPILKRPMYQDAGSAK